MLDFYIKNRLKDSSRKPILADGYLRARMMEIRPLNILERSHMCFRALPEEIYGVIFQYVEIFLRDYDDFARQNLLSSTQKEYYFLNNLEGTARILFLNDHFLGRMLEDVSRIRKRSTTETLASFKFCLHSKYSGQKYSCYRNAYIIIRKESLSSLN